MKLIPITKDEFAMVDDNDYEWLCGYKWTKKYFGEFARLNFPEGGEETLLAS